MYLHQPYWNKRVFNSSSQKPFPQQISTIFKFVPLYCIHSYTMEDTYSKYLVDRYAETCASVCILVSRHAISRDR